MLGSLVWASERCLCGAAAPLLVVVLAVMSVTSALRFIT